MGEAEKVERRCLAVWMRATLALGAEVDEARLIRMEREPVPIKPLSQHFQNPFGVVVPKCRSPFSSTPALSHLSIMRRITPSVTRWSRKARSLSWGMESKYLRTSMSSTQYCPCRVVALCNVRSAWCADRSGRKPYEQDRKSCS